MVLDFTVLGIVAGEAVGCATAVSTVTALGVHAYDYFTDEVEHVETIEEGGKSVGDIEKGVLDFVMSSTKTQAPHNEEGEGGDTKGSQKEERGFFNFLPWNSQKETPKSESTIPNEDETEKDEDQREKKEKDVIDQGSEKSGKEEGFFSFLPWIKDAEATSTEEVVKSTEKEGTEKNDWKLLGFLKGEEPKERKKEHTVEVIEKAPKAEEGFASGLFDFMKGKEAKSSLVDKTEKPFFAFFKRDETKPVSSNEEEGDCGKYDDISESSAGTSPTASMDEEEIEDTKHIDEEAAFERRTIPDDSTATTEEEERNPPTAVVDTP